MSRKAINNKDVDSLIRKMYEGELEADALEQLFVYFQSLDTIPKGWEADAAMVKTFFVQSYCSKTQKRTEMMIDQWAKAHRKRPLIGAAAPMHHSAGKKYYMVAAVVMLAIVVCAQIFINIFSETSNHGVAFDIDDTPFLANVSMTHHRADIADDAINDHRPNRQHNDAADSSTTYMLAQNTTQPNDDICHDKIQNKEEEYYMTIEETTNDVDADYILPERYDEVIFFCSSGCSDIEILNTFEKTMVGV